MAAAVAAVAGLKYLAEESQQRLEEKEREEEEDKLMKLHCRLSLSPLSPPLVGFVD